MANEEQLSILKQGVEVWNKWRGKNLDVDIDLSNANLRKAKLRDCNLANVNLSEADLSEADLMNADMSDSAVFNANLSGADFQRAFLVSAGFDSAKLCNTNLSEATLDDAFFSNADLSGSVFAHTSLVRTSFDNSNLSKANLYNAKFINAYLWGTNVADAKVVETVFASTDLRHLVNIDKVNHTGPSSIGIDTFYMSEGEISEVFLRGCGLRDWEIESAKLYNPNLTNEEVLKIQYKIYDFRATQAIQVSPLFISYSHVDSGFVDRLEGYLNNKGIRFWRDIHDMKSGRMEKQIDRALRLNPTVLLILSEHSLQSDWVEHEVRTARALEKEMKRDVLCPVALDDSWKSSPWAKRIMEQIMEYNILDFSEWKDSTKFENTFNKLIDGLGLFYK